MGAWGACAADVAAADVALDTGVPFVAVVFPIATSSAVKLIEAVDQLDALDVFGVLVPQLSFYA